MTMSQKPFQSSLSTQAKYIGRFDFSDPRGPIFSWPGSSITAKFDGNEIGADFKPLNASDNWLNVIIDDNDLKVIHIDTERTYTLASGLVSGTHEVTIFKRTEAFCGEIQFQGFKLPSQSKLLEPPHPLKRKMEIIGDSISCGYGNESRIQDGFKPEQENNYLAYGSITARNLKADLITLAYSGKGICQNYGGDKVEMMPELYRKILPGSNFPWDFQRWVPDVVVINLGTNDFSVPVDTKAFHKEYGNLVALVRQNYPHASIFCTIGPINLEPGEYIQSIVKQFNAVGDHLIYYLEFPLQDTPKNSIVGFIHPSKKNHAEMAKLLTQEICNKLDWR